MVLVVPLVIGLIIAGRSDYQDRAYYYTLAALLSAAALLGVVLE